MTIVFHGLVYNADEIANRVSAATMLHRGAQIHSYLRGVVNAKRDTIVLREWAPILGFRRDRNLLLLGLRSTLTVRIQLFDPSTENATEPYVIVRSGGNVELLIETKD